MLRLVIISLSVTEGNMLTDVLFPKVQVLYALIWCLFVHYVAAIASLQKPSWNSSVMSIA